MIHSIRTWFKKDPRYSPLKDDSLHIYERELQTYRNFLPERQAKIQKLQQKYGEDYMLLRPLTRLYVRQRILSRDMKYSTAGQIGLYARTKVWLLRLKLSKYIQHSRFNSYAKVRQWNYMKYLWIGLIFGVVASKTDVYPGDERRFRWMYTFPRPHWMASYLVEDTYAKGNPDNFRKDNLAQSLERVMREGIENEELDSLNWLVLGAHFSVTQQDEFSYLAYQMAHFLNHQQIGGNSLQPLEYADAAKLFQK